MAESTKAQTIWSVIVSLVMMFMVWESYDKRKTIEAQKKQLVELKELKVKQDEAMKGLLLTNRSQRAALEGCNSDLETAQVQLQDAKLQAKPCPGTCGVPDCRKLKNMLEGFQACLAYVDQVKAILGSK